MIVLALQYRCVSCGLAIEKPMRLPVTELPATVNGIGIPPPPAGWTFTDGAMHCPEHEPRRVVPVTTLVGLNGGRTH